MHFQVFSRPTAIATLMLVWPVVALPQGITYEADLDLQADLAAAPFTLPEGFSREEMQSERPDLPPPLPGLSFDGSGDGSGDFDQDGLTDAEEAILGTQPDNPDTDGDALLDGWEVNLINGIDLHALGASPLRKDIFVEMDYMIRPDGNVDFRPTEEEKASIIAAFASANVTNPDGSTGISIHLIDGNTARMGAGNLQWRGHRVVALAGRRDGSGYCHGGGIAVRGTDPGTRRRHRQHVQPALIPWPT